MNNNILINEKARDDNDFLNFYGNHGISPVRQEVGDMRLHLARREKLYRQLGIPRFAFRDADMLEVGPGGGYNTLAFFEWGIEHIDLVEANPQGIADMRQNFSDILENRYRIFPCLIEEYCSDKQYDIVIAESFLQNLKNQKQVIEALSSYVCDGGVAVVTTTDEVCFFIEQMKRLIAQVHVCDVASYEEKVKILAEEFAPQLSKLRRVSRPAEDWVQDQLLNPVAVNMYTLSLWEAIEYFGDEFDVLGSSPNMFTDYSWYKDIWYDYKVDYQKQFKQKNLNLLLANMKEEYKSENNDKLIEAVHRVKKLCAEYEHTYDGRLVRKIINCVDVVVNVIESSSAAEELSSIMREIQFALRDLHKKGKVNFAQYPEFFAAFGRTQQYISFIKKERYLKN